MSTVRVATREGAREGEGCVWERSSDDLRRETTENDIEREKKGSTSHSAR